MFERRTRELENEIRVAFDRPTELDVSDEHMQEVREHAYRIYKLRTQIKEARTARRKRRWRRTATAVGVAMAIMVAGLGYAVLTPSLVSDADGAMKVVVREIRGWLHLDINENKPYPNDSISAKGEVTVFRSIEEYQRIYKYPIAYFNEPGLEPSSVRVKALDDAIEEVSLIYSIEGNELVITSSALSNVSSVLMDKDNSGVMLWHGTQIPYWVTDNGGFAWIYAEGLQIRISFESAMIDCIESHLESLSFILPE